MKLKYGLISADSHAQLDRDAFTKRMSRAKWGDRIPEVVEVEDERTKKKVDRWRVYGKTIGAFVANCPAVMNDRKVKYYPQRWEEVPAKVFEPLERAKALDEDGIDAEVLFPNTPIQNFGFLQSKRNTSWPARRRTTARWPNGGSKASASSRWRSSPTSAASTRPWRRSSARSRSAIAASRSSASRAR
jgi:hypothetical protein